ncbi:MAG: ABC transporter permease subunit [Acidobacteriaceae bacterium]|nr:ABC transporter permease subunit [Acidobacteriaceae bacterium]MBV9767586.1 ABC transporter permease subunit [Acidobacteriaceae bacterium]
MRNIWTICRRELYSYFVSPIAWVLLAIFAVVSGFFVYIISAGFVRASLEGQMSGQSFPMNLNEQVIAPLFSNIAVLGLFLIPLISMRLFAEEKRQGTIELLITSPVHDSQIVIGKWLSAVLMYSALLVVMVADCSFLFVYGNPDWRPVATGFLGILLQGASLLALGTFISTLTRNQIIAGAIGFALALVLWILNWWTSFANFAIQWPESWINPVELFSFVMSVLGLVLNYLSIANHMDSFSRGVIDTKDLIYYLSMIFIGLFLTNRSIGWLRWRS